jgi:NAD+ synthase
MTQKIVSLDLEKVNLHIVEWLKSYAQKSNTNGFVIGVSGGIDSAVTSTLCAQTGLPTLCVMLPIHQAQSHIDRKIEHIENLKNRFRNVKSIEINLSESFETLKKSFPIGDNEKSNQLSLANTRSRIRMTTLYYLAGIHGYLVVGTGNKVEDFGVGFYTKYGDGGVDLSPIADLMKSEVFALGQYLNVPKSIQNAVPTDGLFGDERTDEEQIGASYDELEWAMEYEEKKSDATLNSRQQDVLTIYKKLNSNNLHKMNPIPVCKIPIKMRFQ